MEWLVERLTGKVALYACATLLGIAALLAVGLGLQTTRYEDEVRSHADTQAKLGAVKADLEKAGEATKEWKETSETLEGKLAHANRENLRVVEEGQAALRAAQRRARQAEAELSAFREVFAAKTETCAAALVMMEESCPELRDY